MAEGPVGLRDHIAVLEVKMDLQRLHPGLDLVGIRQAGWNWAYYPVLDQAELLTAKPRGERTAI